MSQLIKNSLALIFSIVAVHMAYIGYLRPKAEAVLAAAQQAGLSAPRDVFVILKDYEQEICLMLMLWGIFLIGGKCMAILKDRYLFAVDLIEHASDDASDLNAALESLEKLPPETRDTPLIQAMISFAKMAE